MGANLSVIDNVDTSVDIVSPGDLATQARLAIMWAGAFYVMCMIWATGLLADRWRGPRGSNGISGAGVLAAMLLSTGWPVVVAYLMVTK